MKKTHDLTFELGSVRAMPLDWNEEACPGEVVLVPERALACLKGPNPDAVEVPWKVLVEMLDQAGYALVPTREAGPGLLKHLQDIFQRGFTRGGDVVEQCEDAGYDDPQKVWAGVHQLLREERVEKVVDAEGYGGYRWKS